MKKIESSEMMEVPVEAIWKFLTDLSNFPKWDPAGVEMTQTSAGPQGVGTTLHATLSQYPRVEDFLVIEYEANRRFTLNYTSGPVKGCKMTFDMEPSDGGTRLKIVWDLEYVGFNKLIGPLITRNAKKETATFIGNIKRLVESGPHLEAVA